MLQSIREKTSGWIATVILGLIILTFAFFGIEGYLTSEVVNYAARVEGPPKFWIFGKQTYEISQDEFRKSFDQARQRERTAKGEAFNAAEFETLENKRAVLDQLIDETVSRLAAERDGLMIPTTTVQKAIAEVESFQKNGKFDADTYQLALTSQGMTPRQFDEMVRKDMTQRLLPSQLAASGFTSDAELDSYLRLSQQTRDVQFVEIPPPTVPPTAPTEAEITAWYDANKAKYRSPETVTVEYVELDAASMPVTGVAPEAELRTRYENEKARFGTEEQRFASHILVAVDEKAPAAVADTALAKARDIAAKARAPGADFGALAKQFSDDIGSKDSGGDLGPVGKGVFGDAFDTAFAALKKGDVSDPVRLPDGWHVILYRESIPGSLKPFEAVRAELESEFLEGERERVYNEASSKLVDAVYADPSQLAETAKKFNLTVNRTAPFSRASGEGIAALEPVRKAAFAPAQLTERQTSDPIEVSPNHVVVLRVIEHKPEAAIPLAQVRDGVLNDLNADRLAKASKLRAESLLARARQGESLDVLAAEVSRTVATVPGITRQAPNPALTPLVDEAFRLPHPVAGKRDVGLAKLAPDRYALVTVTAVKDGDLSALDDTTRKTLREQIARVRADVEAKAYIQTQRKSYKIEIAEDRL